MKKIIILVIIFLFPFGLNAQFDLSISLAYNKWINKPDYSFFYSFAEKNDFIHTDGIGFLIKGIYSFNSYFGLGIKSGYLPWEHTYVEIMDVSWQGRELGIVKTDIIKYFIPTMGIVQFSILNLVKFKIMLELSFGIYNQFTQLYENNSKVAGEHINNGCIGLYVGTCYLLTPRLFFELSLDVVGIKNLDYGAPFNEVNYFFTPAVGIGIRI